jgi:hypothetical protein
LTRIHLRPNVVLHRIATEVDHLQTTFRLLFTC